MHPLRILLADDHAMVRAGIRLLLQSLKYVQIVAEAGNGDEALELAHKHRPDIVLMDIAMKQLNGLDATEQIRRELPDILVIILSMHEDEQYVRRALKNGARGYLLKDSATQELEIALNAVMRGDIYLSPAVSRTVIGDFLRQSSDESGPLDALTPRQREILKLIAKGGNTKAIAYQLGVSTKTVESHRALLMQRLDIHDVAGLVRFAVHTGLIKAED